MPVPTPMPGAAIAPARHGATRLRVGLLLVVLALLAGAAILITAGLRSVHPGAHAQPLPQPFAVAPSQAIALPTPAALASPQRGSIQKSCSAASGTAGRIEIASVCIDAPMITTRYVEDAADCPAATSSAGAAGLCIPDDVSLVGLDTTSAPLTARTGTTIIAGHIDNADQGDGAFYFLHDITPGAEITVSDGAGKHSAWRVFRVTVAEKTQVPTDVTTALDTAGKPTGARQLVLVTCGGPLLHYSWGNTYRDNVLVYATPAS